MGFDATRAFPFSDEHEWPSYKTMSLERIEVSLPEVRSPGAGERIPVAAGSAALAEAARTAADIESFWKAVQASHMKPGRAAAKPPTAPVEVEARIDAFWEAVRDRHAAQRPAPLPPTPGGGRKKAKAKPKRKGNGLEIGVKS